MKKNKLKWAAATDIIVTGVNVEQRPLSAKTMKRIQAGIKKFFGKDVDLGLNATSSDTQKKYKRKVAKKGGKS